MLVGDWIDTDLLVAPLVVIPPSNVYNLDICSCVAYPNSFGIDRRDRKYFYGNNRIIFLPEMAISRVGYDC